MRERSELFHELYDKLRQLARGRLVGEYGPEIKGDATSLVHEAYIRLRNWAHAYQNEQHFLSTASAAMRQILVDRARARNSLKRASDRETLSVSLESVGSRPLFVDVLAFDQILAKLSLFDQRAARIVEMRVFLGLTEEEIANELSLSTRTVKRDWSAAITWLKANAKLF